MTLQIFPSLIIYSLYCFCLLKIFGQIQVIDLVSQPELIYLHFLVFIDSYF